ncbi:hypothetical protein QBC41DRAFT_57504 [Cercophora samala]|uniref:Uncharacterized protein n=1 Tax=Cercophora samala TaxID=330535 RepID=A0AA39YME2_9PEZI|nr:hypothetical protein QBC41DRAFT_57504 [Cercophora samala]
MGNTMPGQPHQSFASVMHHPSSNAASTRTPAGPQDKSQDKSHDEVLDCIDPRLLSRPSRLSSSTPNGPASQQGMNAAGLLDPTSRPVPLHSNGRLSASMLSPDNAVGGGMYHPALQGLNPAGVIDPRYLPARVPPSSYSVGGGMYHPTPQSQAHLQGLNPAGAIDPRYLPARAPPSQASYYPVGGGMHHPALQGLNPAGVIDPRYLPPRVPPSQASSYLVGGGMYHPAPQSQANLQGLNPAGVIDPRYLPARAPPSQPSSSYPVNPGMQMPGANYGQGGNFAHQPSNTIHPMPPARMDRQHHPRVSQGRLQNRTTHEDWIPDGHDEDEILEGDFEGDLHCKFSQFK